MVIRQYCTVEIPALLSSATLPNFHLGAGLLARRAQHENPGTWNDGAAVDHVLAYLVQSTSE